MGGRYRIYGDKDSKLWRWAHCTIHRMGPTLCVAAPMVKGMGYQLKVRILERAARIIDGVFSCVHRWRARPRGARISKSKIKNTQPIEAAIDLARRLCRQASGIRVSKTWWVVGIEFIRRLTEPVRNCALF